MRTTESVLALYSKFPYPNRYIGDRNRLKNYSLKALKSMPELYSQLSSGKTSCEFGCGTGEFSNSLSLNGIKIKAIDLCKESLKKAETDKERFNTNAEFIHGNVETVKLNERFDLVFSFGVIHHTEDQEKAFENVLSHAKEKGYVAIGLYNPFGRFRHNIKTKIVSFFSDGTVESKINLAKRFFPKEVRSEIWIADQFAHPHEKSYTIGKILKKFKEHNISFVDSKPKILGTNFIARNLTQLRWLFNSKGNFFILVGRKR